MSLVIRKVNHSVVYCEDDCVQWFKPYFNDVLSQQMCRYVAPGFSGWAGLGRLSLRGDDIRAQYRALCEM